MEYKFFRFSKEFSFVVSDPTRCSVCGELGLWYDTGGYSGVRDIDCICDRCLSAGELMELEIEANMNFDDGSEDAKTITYKTPALPTWQDTAWPMIDGKFPVFERIASREDFLSKAEFLSTFAGSDQESSEIEWIWEVLPGKQLAGYKDAGDISVYLFSLEGNKYWVWDAN